MIRHHIVKRHRSAKSIVHEALSDELSGVDDPRDLLIPAHPSSYGPAEMTYLQFLAHIRGKRRWAFVVCFASKRKPAELHWWAAPGEPPESIAEMIGHEMGHLSDTPLEDLSAEEDRADTFAAVALQTFCFMSTLKKKKGRTKASCKRTKASKR